jgi:WD40 repeat protein
MIPCGDGTVPRSRASRPCTPQDSRRSQRPRACRALRQRKREICPHRWSRPSCPSLEPQHGHNDQGLFGPRLRGSLNRGVSFETHTHTLSSRFPAARFILHCVAFSSAHDNTKFVSSGGDRSVFLWDVTTGNTIRRISAHLAKINVVEFNADASVMASGKCISMPVPDGHTPMHNCRFL